MSRLSSHIVANFARVRPPLTGVLPRDSTTAEATPDESLSNLSGLEYFLLPAAIFSISFFSIKFSHMANYVQPLWPCNAVILVALLRHTRTLANYGFILLSSAVATGLAGILQGNSVALDSILVPASMCEVAVALALLSYFRVGASNLTSLRNLLIFIVAAGFVAPLGGVLVCCVGSRLEPGFPWSAIWRNWYAGHALGMIIVAPFLISLTSSEWHGLRNRRLPEAVGMLALLIAIATGIGFFRPLIFISAPVILFATLRFGLIGATVATLLTALIGGAFVITGFGHPLLSQPELTERILALQAFLTMMSLWSLPVAALLTERGRLLQGLSRANAQLTAESERKTDLVTGLRRHLTMAEEKERLRLSHELHDQTGQDLVAAILELNEIDAMVNGRPRERLHLVRKKMEEMGHTLHRIAWELRPPAIDELGLRKALASYVAAWSEQCGVDIDFHCGDARLDAVPTEISTAIYRVVQEGLTNIVKHAQRPANASVVIRRSDNTLSVIIEDNGCGFDLSAAMAKLDARRGLGLDGMRERLILVGGTLEIETAPGAGTTIFARFVLDTERPVAGAESYG